MWRTIGIGLFGLVMSQGLEAKLNDIMISDVRITDVMINDVRLINPAQIQNERIEVSITEPDSIRINVRDAIRKVYPNALAFGTYLDSIEDHARDLKELVPDTLTLYIKVPEYLLEDSLNVWIEVNKAKGMLYLHSEYGLLFQAEAKTGGYHFYDDKKVNYGTPNGTYYINRLVKNPYWYPPEWAEPGVVEPGKENPLGEWMAELCHIPTRAGYDFSPSEKPTMLRIHGSHYSNKNPNRFFYALPTHGCIRLKQEDAEELSKALMRYVLHYESKQTARGTIIPLHTPIKVTIQD